MTRSARRSTSWRMCELTITVRPCRPSSLNSVMSTTRWTGSAPFSGSSRTSTDGSVTSAAATFARWRMPLLNPPNRRSATSSRPTAARLCSGASRSDTAMQVGGVVDELASGERLGHGLVLGYEGHEPLDLPIGPRVAPADADGAPVHADEPRHRPHQRRLARAVGPEEAGQTRPEGARQLRERDLRAEPDRHVRHLDHRRLRERRIQTGCLDEGCRADVWAGAPVGGDSSVTPRPSGSATAA